MAYQKHLSIYFSKTRSYFVAIEETESGILLTDIQSTSQPLSRTAISDELNSEGVNELRQSLINSDIKPDDISIVLPTDNFIISKIPFANSFTGNSLKELIELELKYHFDEIDINKIRINITPFIGKDSAKDFLLLTIFDKKLIDLCNDILSCINMTVKEILPSQFSVYRAFIHNYTKQSGNNLLLGINDNILEFSKISNSKPETLNFRAFESKEELNYIIFNDILKISNLEDINNIFLYGEQLTKQLYEIIRNKLTNIQIVLNRMSAFSKMRTNADKRIIDYCSRTAHIYPACIGACFKNTIETIELLNND